MVHLFFSAALVLLCGPALAEPISGAARVVDGDTLVVQGQRIRLAGIDAPERSQTCAGRGGEVYECGRDAGAVMVELTRWRVVMCEPKDRDRYGRIVAVCGVDGTPDLGAAMVRRGWAVSYRRYDRECRYCADEERARRESLGIWSGRFTMPEDFRRARR
jgi:endonuclease YncB( thermonuclease family)